MEKVTKADILQATRNGLDVFNYYLPYDLPMRKNFRSPFYEDTKASCNIFEGKDGVWRFKDFGDGGQGGDCFWFVAMLKGFNLKSDFPKVLDVINDDLQLYLYDGSSCRNSFSNKPSLPMKRSNPKISGGSLPSPSPAPSAKYSYTKKEFSEWELSFWSHYGVTKAILKQFNVYSLKSFSSFKGDGTPYTVQASEAAPMFLYDMGASVKIYRPFSDLRFLNAGERSETTIFGLEQLPLKGDIVFITGGEKDVLSLSARGFNAISFNSETSMIDPKVVEMLKHRFKHILICYDMDDTGVKASKHHIEMLKEYGVLRLELPLKGNKTEKDVSDYFALGHTRDDLQEIITGTLVKNLYRQTMVLLKSCEIDLNNPPDASKTLLMLNNTILGSFDNLLCLTGGEGTGKSNYVSALISGAISQIELPAEKTLGMSVAPNPEGKAVLLYDTEQSDAQLFKNVKRCLKRAGMSDLPPYYHPLCLTTFSRSERLQLIKDSLDMYYHKHDGVHLVVLDGVADLINSANNEIESVQIVEELYRLAGIYNTCIVCVLHLTPGGLKLRGHLGSELQRKAAGIISIDKDKINPSLSVVKAVKVRDGDPLDVPMMTYSWDKSLDMHVYRGNKSEKETEQRKFEDLKRMASETLSTSGVMSYSDFVAEISKRLLAEYNLKDRRTAIARIDYMLETGIIEQTEQDEIRLGDR